MKILNLLRGIRNRSKKTSQLGFTMLELLVVISIIGILIGLISVSFTNAQQKSRDARRRGDLKAAQSAFEQYNAVNSGSYPASGQYGNIEQLPAGLPVDPRGDAYTLTGDEDGYCMCAEFETDAGNSTNSSCAYGSGTFFCVENQQ